MRYGLFFLFFLAILTGCGDDGTDVAASVDNLEEKGIYRIQPKQSLILGEWREGERLAYADVKRSTKSVDTGSLPEDFWMEIQPYTLELVEGDRVSVEIAGVDEIHTIIKKKSSQQFFSPRYDFEAGSSGVYVLIVFPLALSRWSNEIEYDIIVDVQDDSVQDDSVQDDMAEGDTP